MEKEGWKGQKTPLYPETGSDPEFLRKKTEDQAGTISALKKDLGDSGKREEALGKKLKETRKRTADTSRETFDSAWKNDSNMRNTQRLAWQLSPQNTKKTVDSILEGSDNVKRATEEIEKTSKAREEKIGKAEKSTETKKTKDEVGGNGFEDMSTETLQQKLDTLLEQLTKIQKIIDERKKAEEKSSENKAEPKKQEDKKTNENGKTNENPKPTTAVKTEDKKPEPETEEQKRQKEIRKAAEELVSQQIQKMQLKFNEEVEKINKDAQAKIKEIKDQAQKEITAAKEADKKEGKEEGQRETLNEIKEKRSWKEKFRIFFRPKTEVERYLRKKYLKTVGAVALGAAITLGTWATMQYFGYFLPFSVPIKEILLNGIQIR